MFIINNVGYLVIISLPLSLSPSLTHSQDTSYMFVTGPKVVEVQQWLLTKKLMTELLFFKIVSLLAPPTGSY